MACTVNVTRRCSPSMVHAPTCPPLTTLHCLLAGGRYAAVIRGVDFMATVDPLTVEYPSWTLPILGQLSFQLVRAGTAPQVTPTNSSAQAQLLVDSVMLGLVDVDNSLNATHLQRYAEAGRSPVQAVINASVNDTSPPGTIPVPVGGVNLLYIPALRSGSTAAGLVAVGNYSWFATPGQVGGSGFVRNPGLNLTMLLVQLAANGSALSATQQTLNGSWSSSQQAYLVGFKCGTSALYRAQLQLAHSNGSATLQVRHMWGCSWCSCSSLRAVGCNLSRLGASSHNTHSCKYPTCFDVGAVGLQAAGCRQQFFLQKVSCIRMSYSIAG